MMETLSGWFKGSSSSAASSSGANQPLPDHIKAKEDEIRAQKAALKQQGLKSKEIKEHPEVKAKVQELDQMKKQAKIAVGDRVEKISGAQLGFGTVLELGDLDKEGYPRYKVRREDSGTEQLWSGRVLRLSERGPRDQAQDRVGLAGGRADGNGSAQQGAPAAAAVPATAAAGAATPQAAPYGAASPSSYPAGPANAALPPGATQPPGPLPGQPPGAAMPPGAMPPGAMPPGAMPLGATPLAGAAVAGAAAEQLRPGAAARLRGLHAEWARYNGMEVRLAQYDQARGVWDVRCEGQPFEVTAEHLEPMQQGAAPSEPRRPPRVDRAGPDARGRDGMYSPQNQPGPPTMQGAAWAQRQGQPGTFASPASPSGRVGAWGSMGTANPISAQTYKGKDADYVSFNLGADAGFAMPSRAGGYSGSPYASGPPGGAPGGSTVQGGAPYGGPAGGSMVQGGSPYGGPAGGSMAQGQYAQGGNVTGSPYGGSNPYNSGGARSFAGSPTSSPVGQQARQYPDGHDGYNDGPRDYRAPREPVDIPTKWYNALFGPRESPESSPSSYSRSSRSPSRKNHAIVT